jgi:hypothetical protein
MSTREPIEITPELERRVSERRKEGVDRSEKVRKFDDLRAEAMKQFEFWLASYRDTDRTVSRNVSGYFEGRMHTWAEVLRELGDNPQCICYGCTTIEEAKK